MKVLIKMVFGMEKELSTVKPKLYHMMENSKMEYLMEKVRLQE